MQPRIDRTLDAHPRAGPAWYLALAHLVGSALTLPGLRRLRPLAVRTHAVTRAAEQVSVSSEPIGPAERAAPGIGTEAVELTVLAANLWHDWPRHQRWEQRLEAFADLVEDVGADVLLLQEVARTAARAADVWLAERLGFSRAYGRANGDLGAIGFEEGPAVLSRFPLLDVRLHQLTHGHNPLVRRVALGARVTTPVGPLLVVTVHLGLLQRHNAGQIRRLRDWVRRTAAGDAAVVGGDFNAPEHSAEIARTARLWTDTFRHAHPHADATTHERTGRWRPGLRRRLDYVFVHQSGAAHWHVVAAGHLEARDGPHSDHLAVLARLAARPLGDDPLP
jgi:endonuclease/exonuclease/phosphatase family metal-dependent hydrolase